VIVTQQAEKEDAALPVISVRNVSAGYGDQTIIERISFDVYPEEVLAILGRSGCGKTTLFKVMVGLLEPIEGEVVIDGVKVIPLSEGGSDHVLRSIGVLFQSGALFSSMTIADNVALPLRQQTDLDEKIVERIVSMKLFDVGLAGYEGHLPSELSGGMRKRAALARAVALDPKILFFDEPSAGLDPVTSARLDEMILEINRNLGTTMVIVTHELASVMATADRVVMLDRDEKTVIAQGTPSELRESDDDRVRDFFSRSPAHHESER
jgi:phospholipid/cholesterol/gamma-HCH transport system ATP-binding protein